MSHTHMLSNIGSKWVNLPLWSYRLSPSDFSLQEQFGVMSVLNVILTVL